MNKALRLVSYNILEGLRPMTPSSGERRLMDRERAELARKIVKELDPDILVLNEALFCRQHDGKAVDYGKLFDFPHQTAALFDQAWGNAILSRHPIANSSEMKIYNRGGLVATIDTPCGVLTVASYHPHPGRYPENKAADFSRLVVSQTGPLIVCGDLNCINPEDRPDREKLIESFHDFTSEAELAVDRFIESGKAVFHTLDELGLRDAIPEAGRRFSIPTDLINTDKSSGMRIDHVLANEPIQVISGEVIHSEMSDRASDHHPVILEFRILAT
jgi:endonuclease/exonuclease/phosphatase family metal-dependent hydrolase